MSEPDVVSNDPQRRGALMAVLVLVVVAGLTGLWLIGDGAEDPTARPEATEGSSGPPVKGVEPSVDPTEGVIDGMRWWTAPSAEEAGRLPVVDSPLPERIDLAVDARSWSVDPVDRALAVFAVMTNGSVETPGDPRVEDSGVLLLGDDSRLRRVTFPDLEHVPQDPEPENPENPDDASVAPFGSLEVSPDGTRLVLPQPQALLIADLTKNTEPGWRQVPVQGGTTTSLYWEDNQHVRIITHDNQDLVVNIDTGEHTRPQSTPEPAPTPPIPRGWWPEAGEVSSGVARHEEHAAYCGLPNRAPPPAREGPYGAIAVAGPDPALLVFPESVNIIPCIPVSWLDDDTVVYEVWSAGPPRRLFAWNIRTGAVQRVTEIEPQARLYYSFADLAQW